MKFGLKAISRTMFKRIIPVSMFLAFAIHSLKEIVVVGGSISIEFVIQSNKQDPFYLDKRIEEFIDQFCEQMKSMSNEGFRDAQTALISSYIEPMDSNYAEARAWGGNISSNLYNFYENIEMAQ